MLTRFSLYGFLKNQQYYEPFLLLALLEKGLSFTQIGLLVAFREVCVNIMEVPSGAVADVVGRRRCMVLSLLSYIVSFAIFGLAEPVWALFAAMLAFSIGDAFRTGTHKAMIFDWLDREGRTDEKTRIYGLTRSWSKLGSAVSAVIAAALVFVTGKFSSVFLLSIVPYMANVVNIMTYPRYLDRSHSKAGVTVRSMALAMYAAVGQCLQPGRMRRLLGESMCFEGTYKVCKDYLQTIIQAAALALPFMVGFGDSQRTAVVAAPVFLVLFCLSSVASRRAHVLAEIAGSEDRGATWLWWAFGGVFVAIAASSGLGTPSIAILAFVMLAVLQNLWRPMLIGRIAGRAAPSRRATVLSVESQGKSLVAAGLAPLVGLAVDRMPVDMKFLPVGVVGLLVAAMVLATAKRAGHRQATQDRSGQA